MDDDLDRPLAAWTGAMATSADPPPPPGTAPLSTAYQVHAADAAVQRARTAADEARRSLARVDAAVRDAALAEDRGTAALECLATQAADLDARDAGIAVEADEARPHGR